MTSRAPAYKVTSAAAPRHRNAIPLSYDDVNIPSDSYFTGDEEVPLWDVPDHVPFLVTVTAARVANADASYVNGTEGKLLGVLGRLLLAQFSAYVGAADNGSSGDSTHSDDVITPRILMTSPAAGVDRATMTTRRYEAYVPRTTSPLSQLHESVSRRVAATTTTATSTRSRPAPSSPDGSHVLYDVTTTTTTSPAVRTYTVPQPAPHKTPTPRKHKVPVVEKARRPAPPAGTGLLGGFGPWGGHGEADYFDFFDYIVDYQTRRPPKRRVEQKSRRPRKKMKSGRGKVSYCFCSVTITT